LEVDVVGLELETNVSALDLEMEINVPQETSKQERFSAE
jgi:hypothetical protein